MNLRRLGYFVVLAEELHFGRAAATLNMAQPPLSQQIRRLEAELGVALFKRTTRHVELTSAGRLLYPQAQHLLGEAESLERIMDECRTGGRGLLRLGFVDSSSYEVMPRLLREYRQRWPDVTFELHTMSSERQRGALLAGELDLGIARSVGPSPKLHVTTMLEEPLFVAMDARHHLARASSVDLAELLGCAFVGFDRSVSPGLHAELEELLGVAGVGYDPDIEAEEYTTVLGLVAAGEGVAVVPAVVRTFQPPDLVYVPIRNPEATMRLLMLSRSDEELLVVGHALELASELFTTGR